MTICRCTLLVAALVASGFVSPVSTQPQSSEPYIVTFREAAPFASFPRARVDDRARSNPAAWSYLDRAVVGAVQAFEERYGFRADHVYSAAVRGFSARLTRGQVAALQRLPFVASIEPDAPMTPFDQVLPWGIDRVDGDLSSTLSGDGSGEVTNVNVYVIDAGVDRSHPDLNVVNHVNFTWNSNSASCAHGTRVSGVLAARDDSIGVVGMLPGAPITAVKVVSCDPIIAWTSWAIKGVDWVTANAQRPAVANMSIGGFYSYTLDRAVRRSADSGIVYAIAAGNQASDACLTSPQSAGPHAGVIVVAATTPSDGEAWWSSFGSCVDIWAPGTDILTTDLGGGYAVGNGTSYASPHVAGAAGLYLSNNSSESAAFVEWVLLTDAVIPGTRSKDFSLIRLLSAARY